MTIKEALTTKTSQLGVTPAALDLAILEADLDGSADYTPATNGKEDDVSVKYTTDLRGIYSAIMRKWGLVDPFAPVVLKPTVKQVRFW
jgi:hypothetical protein